MVIVPVGDRDKFLAKVHGTKGADGDDFGRAACKLIDGRYACAEHRETLARLGGAHLDAVRQAAGARGDLELAGSFTGPTVAVIAQLGKNAKRAYAETSEYPRGDVGLTPARPCCGQPDNRCATTAGD